MILMSRENPGGHKLEELLHTLQEELVVKTNRISNDACPVSQQIVINNHAIIELLRSAEVIQRQSMSALDSLGPNQGPSSPRIG